MTEKEELEYEMRDHYDLSHSRPSPYAARARAANHLVQIEPELFAEFPDSDTVNRALRLVLEDSALVMKVRAPHTKAI